MDRNGEKKMFLKCVYLESGNHNSWVSKFESSVSVEVAECGCFGVDGKLVFSRRRHVHLRSEITFLFSKTQTNISN